MAKIVNFSDGASSSTTPTIGNIVASDLVTYPDDATYEASESGAPADGNIYYNTTLDLIRYYSDGAWSSIVDNDSTQTIENKTIDGTDASGNNTVTNDATDVSYDNTTSSMAATDAQGAIDEVEGRVDTNETDIANLETLSGVAGATDNGTFTGTTIPDSSDTKVSLQALETEVELKIDSSEKGANNGVAELDGTGRLPTSQLPVTAMEFQGSFNATTDSPDLTDGSGDTGDFYRVSVAGTVDHGAGNVTYAIGDSVIYNGTIWEKYAEVTLADTDSLTEGSTNLYYTEARVTANTSVTANTAKVSADGSIDTHSDVDTSTVAPNDGEALVWNNADSEWQPGVVAASPAVRSDSSAFTALITDDIMLNDSSGGIYTITLPTASGNTGKTFTIKKTDSSFNAITVDGDGAETIDGFGTVSLDTQNEVINIVSDGTNWEIIERRIPSLTVAYTPTFTGFGTAGSVNFTYQRIGNTCRIEGTFVSGTATATEARISLPSGLTQLSSIPTRSLAGLLIRGTATGNVFYLLKESASAYFTVSVGSGGGSLSKLNGDNIGSSLTVSVSADIPITGWDA